MPNGFRSSMLLRFVQRNHGEPRATPMPMGAVYHQKGTRSASGENPQIEQTKVHGSGLSDQCLVPSSITDLVGGTRQMPNSSPSAKKTGCDMFSQSSRPGQYGIEGTANIGRAGSQGKLEQTTATNTKRPCPTQLWAPSRKRLKPSGFGLLQRGLGAGASLDDNGGILGLVGRCGATTSMDEDDGLEHQAQARPKFKAGSINSGRNKSRSGWIFYQGTQIL